MTYEEYKRKKQSGSLQVDQNVEKLTPYQKYRVEKGLSLEPTFNTVDQQKAAKQKSSDILSLLLHPEQRVQQDEDTAKSRQTMLSPVVRDAEALRAQQEATNKQAQKEISLRQKYGNLTYSQVKEKLNIMPKDTEEYEWLSNYAPTVMTAADYDAEISSTSAQITNLEAVLEEYNRLTKQVSTQNPDAYANVRLAEIRKQYGSSTDIEAELENLKAKRYNYENSRKYGFLHENADFAEKSKPTQTSATGNYFDYLFQNGKFKYDFINGLTHVQNNGTEAEQKIAGFFDKNLSYMSNDEKAIYNYLYNTQSADAADDYLKSLESVLGERASNYTLEEWTKAAKEAPLGASIASVPLKLWGGVGYVDSAAQKAIKGVQESVTGEYAGPVNYNSAAMMPSKAAATIRRTVEQGLADDYGTIQIDEQEHPVLGKILNGKSVGDVYQLGMSMVDSAAVAVLSAATGVNCSVLLAGDAATQQTLSAVKNGANDEQALTMGLLAGGFEWLFEKYELDHLLGADSNVLKTIVNQAITEAAGEGATSISNMIADTIVMAEKSDWRRSIADYMKDNPGMTEEEATKLAFMDAALQVGWDVVGGTVSGSIMGGGFSGIKNANATSATQQTQSAPVNGEVVKDAHPQTEQETAATPKPGSLEWVQELNELGKGTSTTQQKTAEPKPGTLEWVQELNELGRGTNATQSNIDTSSITLGMTDEQRHIVLTGKAITPVVDANSVNYAEEMSTIKSLPAKAKSKVEKTIRALATKLGILNKNLKTPDVEIDFQFSSKGLRKSLHQQLKYGGSYTDFAGAISNLEKILQNAVLIEQHTDKYVGTSRADQNLERVYVLFGAFQDGKSIVPVQFEIKKSSDVGGKLYVTVAMTKIEADVPGTTIDDSQSRSLISASKYSLSEIFQKINPADKHFLKYLPDNFLTENQIIAKQEALKEDADRISRYKKGDAQANSGDSAGVAVQNKANATESVGAAPSGFDPNTHLQYQYGTLPEGENAVRSDDLPVSTDGANRVSQTAVTVKGAKVTSDEFADLLTKDVTERNGMTYIPITNDATVQKAIKHITNEGWEAAKAQWHADVHAGKTGADMSAVGALLLNNAAKAGDKTAWLDILHDYQIMGTNTAQGLQALRILKKLAPSDKLYMAKRSIKQMVDDMRLDTEVTIDPDLETEYNDAETDEQRDEVLKKIQKNVAQQLPTTFMEKFTALRYVNMLGNLRTQDRNIVGNLSMKAVRSMHNAVATGIETVANKASGGQVKRTRSLTVNKAQKAAAARDFDGLKDHILDGGKYTDSMTATGFARGVQEQKQIFKFQPLEGYRKVTNWAMEQGDIIFARDAYARALAGYLKANGITETDYSKVDSAIMDDARLFAAKEAQEATFRDTNALSGWVSKIGRRKDTPAAAKVISEGIMPFRKTPANVLVRAEEYSPLGVINSVVTSIKAMQKDSDVTATQVINSWAKTLTGTGLFGLGMLLQNLGLLSTGPDEDEKKEGFEELNGWQNYALTLPDGTNLTIDFLSPSAIPMLMGAELMRLMGDESLTLKDIESALTSIADPMVEMSMLQGVNDALENIQYADDNLGQFLINAGLSYLTQGLTNTLAGQVERSFEDSRRQTYVDKDSEVPSWLQRTLGKASAKMPGWDYNQIPYINAWGEEEENPPTGLNLAYNLLSPAYFDKGKDDPLTRELNRLNDAQSDVNVYPSTPDKTLTIDNQDYNLTAEEYVQLAKLQGKTQKKLVEKMISSSDYKQLSDKDKAKAIRYVYDYARDYARGDVIKEHPGVTTKWMQQISDDPASGILRYVATGTTDKYTEIPVSSASYVVDLLYNLKPEDGHKNVRDIQKVEAITGSKLTDEQQKFVLEDTLGDKSYAKCLEVLALGMDLDEYADSYRIYLDAEGAGKKKRTIKQFQDEFNISYDTAKSLYEIYCPPAK